MVRPETQRQPSAVVEDKHAAANAELARLLKEPPLTVDCQKLMAELEALERRDPDAKSMLQRGLAKYEYAERAQHASRVKKWTDAIKELMVMPLDVDTVALAAAIKALTALAPADTSILDRGEAALAVAQAKQAEASLMRRHAAAAEIERCAAFDLILLRIDELEAAIAEAEAAGVDASVLARGRERLVAAARRSQAAADLTYTEKAGGTDGLLSAIQAVRIPPRFSTPLTTRPLIAPQEYPDAFAEPLWMRTRCTQALKCGVLVSVVLGSQQVGREREQARTPIIGASALLKAHVSLPATDVDLYAAEAALKAATAVGVPAEEIEVCMCLPPTRLHPDRASSPTPAFHSLPLVSLLFVRIGRAPFLPPHSYPIPASRPQSASRQLQAVNEAHDRRDSLGSALVLLTVADPPTAQPPPSQLKAQLEEAKQAGVPARLLEAVAARLERRPLESRAAQHQAVAARLQTARQRRELSATRYRQAQATSASLREAAKVRVATRRCLTRVGASCSGMQVYDAPSTARPDCMQVYDVPPEGTG